MATALRLPALIASINRVELSAAAGIAIDDTSNAPAMYEFLILNS